MATWTEAGELWNTTAGNKTVTATPSANDLIVVVAGATSASTPTISVSDNNAGGGGTYDLITSESGGGTGGLLRIYVRKALISSATSTIFTATIGTDTGGGLTVMRLSGMALVGSSAVRQFVGESTQTENPPSMAFGFATLTGNPVILAVLGEDNPLALTDPAGFTNTTATGYNTPPTGITICFANSGVTNSTYAWTGGAVTVHCEVGAELDVNTVAVFAAAGRIQQTMNSGMVGILRK